MAIPACCLALLAMGKTEATAKTCWIGGHRQSTIPLSKPRRCGLGGANWLATAPDKASRNVIQQVDGPGPLAIIRN